MPSKVIQQLLNILQAANVEAVKIELNDGGCKSLVRSLLFADGPTGDSQPLSPPVLYVGDYLVSYTTPGGETALLTRAQAEVIMEFWDLPKAEGLRVPLGTAPLGCCTDQDGSTHNNYTQSQCQCPPHQSWSQGPCGGYGGGGGKHAAAVAQAASGQGRDCGGS